MRTIFCGLLLIGLLAQCARQQASKPVAEAPRPRRVEILFLGDNGHHKPAERVPQLMAALGNRGINITYTDKLTDLNAQNLARFDGLLIYANWDSIPKPQEQALIDYVAAGHGLIPVHSASWCFRNSPEYVQKLVGGQFWRHRFDTIQTRTVRPEHPAMMGFQAFKAYDETYLHSQLQPDNEVLAVRDIKKDQAADRPGVNEEPYTWTRTYGKGRIFYTAYGHDERTWSQPGFHKLLENGILWAVGDVVKQGRDALNPQPFAYTEARLPNYEKRPGPQLQQAALSPEESMKHLQVPVDFSLELFAHEPDVMHPIALSWDERGRLFVLITKDYPNERKDTGGSDYILICEDTNRDGKADKFTRFAEGLSVPTGLVFANGGLIVSQAPHMLFLRDTDGDDRADEKKILFTGFGTFDTHAGPSNLRYGFDNWIYGCVGYSGFKGKVGGDSLKFGQAFFRFKPDGSAMEHLTNTSNNTWGFAFNEAGEVFGSTANNSHGWYMAIPHRYFRGAPFLNENGSRSTDTHKDMKPITPRVRQVDVFGGFTAAAGHSFYTARAFPKEYWNRVAFVCEPTGHIVHQNVMRKNGTDYEDAEGEGVGFNLMAGADEWFSPVAAEVGPDGAVWVADWYSFIIQHNPTPQGFDNGRGNAYDTDLRDYTHGRIYRVAYKKAPVYNPLSLSKDRPQELIAALKNDNLFWRMHAQRLLVERGQKDVVPQLAEMLSDTSVDEFGNNPAVLHALWTMHGLNALSGNIERLYSHPAAAVRRAMLQITPPSQDGWMPAFIMRERLLQDKDPLVVLQALLLLSQSASASNEQKHLLGILTHNSFVSQHANDRWIPDAFAVLLSSHNGRMLKTYLDGLARTGPKPATEAHHNHAMTGTVASPAAPATQVQSSASGNGPDLVIAGIQITPESPEVRQGTRIEVRVTNAGGVAIPEGTPVPLALRIEGPSGAASPAKIDYVSVAHTTGIRPGETVTISRGNNGPWNTEFRVSFERAGSYRVTAMLDRDNQIAETNEANNTASRSLVYRTPKDLSAYALERAARSYVSAHSADSAVALLRWVPRIPADEAQALIKGVADGWNPKQKVTLSPDGQQLVASLTPQVSADNRERFNRLLEAWNLRSADADLDPDAVVVTLKTVQEEMRYDKKTLSVPAGKTVVLVLENPDAMQHNVVVGKPKSLDVIGNAADKMITAKDGAEKNYVPAIPQVLAASPLVNPGQTYRLTFKAPTEPGDYPFVCTFPGHWRLMNGVMRVTAAGQAIEKAKK